MTTTAGSQTEEDLADHWLNTGRIPVLSQDGTKSYPKRSDLRRAEARRTSHSHPAGSRRPGTQPSHQRPPSPVSALRSREAMRRPTLQAQYPIALTPAVLPIPQTSPERPAGIALPVPQPVSPDAFHRPTPQAPQVPIAVSAEWGLDLTDDETPPGQSAEDASKRRFGRLHATATRLLVMALVVGAEGVAVSQFADLGEADGSSSTAEFALNEVQEQASAEHRAAAERQAQAEVERQRAATAAIALEDLKDGSPAKADAALAQSQKANADLARQRKARAEAAKAEREAAKRAAAKRAAVPAKTNEPSKTPKTTAPKAAAEVAKPTATKTKAKSSAKPKAEKKKSATPSSRKKALANARKNPQAAAKVLLTDRGWSSSQYTCLDSLWTRESNWNYQATNPSSGAYGIPQALPGNKMGAAGGDWKSNPVTQIRWGLDYISDRYGTPCGAWNHSESHGWY